MCPLHLGTKLQPAECVESQHLTQTNSHWLHTHLNKFYTNAGVDVRMGRPRPDEGNPYVTEITCFGLENKLGFEHVWPSVRQYDEVNFRNISKELQHNIARTLVPAIWETCESEQLEHHPLIQIHMMKFVIDIGRPLQSQTHLGWPGPSSQPTTLI